MITPCYVLYQEYCGLQLKTFAFTTVWETKGAVKEVLMVNECMRQAALFVIGT